jgi:hypothetical protein
MKNEAPIKRNGLKNFDKKKAPLKMQGAKKALREKKDTPKYQKS